MKKSLFILFLLALSAKGIIADDYNDDIYYNPKKEKKSEIKKSLFSNYNPDFQNQDVDEYNRRGQYYLTPVDTIGQTIENGEDFVYTQQIQKYYNPTIVIDNSDILADIINNSYGNVEIVYNGLTPAFVPLYSSWYPWGWNVNIGSWGWSIGWNSPYYNPWYNQWYYGPSWAWGPAWGWNPSWNWSPAWRPGPVRPGFHHISYRPGGIRPAVARPGWTSIRPGSRPGTHVSARPSASTRPSTTARPGYNRPGNSNSSQTTRPTTHPGFDVNKRPNTVTNQTIKPSTPTTSRPAVVNGGSKRGGYNGGGNSNGNRTNVSPNRSSSSERHVATPSNHSNYNSGSSRGGFNSGGSHGGSGRGGYSGGSRGAGRVGGRR